MLKWSHATGITNMGQINYYCKTGGFPAVRHNEVRDITASLLSEVCHGVTVEPHLQPLSGESMSRSSAINEDGARLDVAAYGFWGGRF